MVLAAPETNSGVGILTHLFHSSFRFSGKRLDMTELVLIGPLKVISNKISEKKKNLVEN